MQYHSPLILMKKVLFSTAFALLCLATSSAHAQSTISPVPGAPDRPHQPAPTTAPNDQVYGDSRSASQALPNKRGQYKEKHTRGSRMSTPARKEMKMQRKMDKSGSM
jgi:hypothetical protein